MNARRASNEPGPEEQAELAREEEREARDEEIGLVDADPDSDDDGEATLEEMLEIDQVELDELGLSLDDPHQPDSE